MKNYLEQQYLEDNLFVEENYLEINYVPDEILHRDQELLILSKIFIKIIENPFKISRKILIQGPIGVGKTLITKVFGKMILQSAKKRELNVKYIHINCRKQKSSYKILREILNTLGLNIPKRGYSSQELVSTLQKFLKKERTYLILTLDELNYLLKSEFDLIYTLSRLNDADLDQNSFLSLISIVRDFTLLKNLDNSTLSTLQENVLKFKKYTSQQLFEILEQRIKKAVKQGVFDCDLIEYTSNICSDSGDVRRALNIARNSVKIAEYKNKNEVELEDIQDAIKTIIPSLQNDVIYTLKKHELILLKALIEIIRTSDKIRVNIIEIKQKYFDICNSMKEVPRKNTRIWSYLQSLTNSNITQIFVKSKGQRGRTSFYSIKNIPLELLEEKVNERLKKREKEL